MTAVNGMDTLLIKLLDYTILHTIAMKQEKSINHIHIDVSDG